MNESILRSLDYDTTEDELWKLPLDLSFCAVTADSRSREPHGRKAYFCAGVLAIFLTINCLAAGNSRFLFCDAAHNRYSNWLSGARTDDRRKRTDSTSVPCVASFLALPCRSVKAEAKIFRCLSCAQLVCFIKMCYNGLSVNTVSKGCIHRTGEYEIIKK